MIRIIVVMLLLTASAANAQEAARAGSLSIGSPWARASMGTSRPGAAYLTITNEGATSDALVAIRSPEAAMPMLHETTLSPERVARMEHVERLEIPAGAAVTLEPGGRHIMLMELSEPLAEGETITLGLVFEEAGEVELSVPVLGIAARGSEER